MILLLPIFIIIPQAASSSSRSSSYYKPQPPPSVSPALPCLGSGPSAVIGEYLSVQDVLQGVSSLSKHAGALMGLGTSFHSFRLDISSLPPLHVVFRSLSKLGNINNLCLIQSMLRMMDEQQQQQQQGPSSSLSVDLLSSSTFASIFHKLMSFELVSVPLSLGSLNAVTRLLLQSKPTSRLHTLIVKSSLPVDMNGEDTLTCYPEKCHHHQASFKAFFAALPPSLLALLLDSNSLGAVGLDAFTSVLTHHTSRHHPQQQQQGEDPEAYLPHLQHLDLSDNGLSSKSVSNFIACLSTPSALPRLKKLDLTGNTAVTRSADFWSWIADAASAGGLKRLQVLGTGFFPSEPLPVDVSTTTNEHGLLNVSSSALHNFFTALIVHCHLPSLKSFPWNRLRVSSVDEDNDNDGAQLMHDIGLALAKHRASPVLPAIVSLRLDRLAFDDPVLGIDKASQRAWAAFFKGVSTTPKTGPPASPSTTAIHLPYRSHPRDGLLSALAESLMTGSCFPNLTTLVLGLPSLSRKTAEFFQQAFVPPPPSDESRGGVVSSSPPPLTGLTLQSEHSLDVYASDTLMSSLTNLRKLKTLVLEGRGSASLLTYLNNASRTLAIKRLILCGSSLSSICVEALAGAVSAACLSKLDFLAIEADGTIRELSHTETSSFFQSLTLAGAPKLVTLLLGPPLSQPASLHLMSLAKSKTRPFRRLEALLVQPPRLFDAQATLVQRMLEIFLNKPPPKLTSLIMTRGQHLPKSFKDACQNWAKAAMMASRKSGSSSSSSSKAGVLSFRAGRISRLGPMIFKKSIKNMNFIETWMEYDDEMEDDEDEEEDGDEGEEEEGEEGDEEGYHGGGGGEEGGGQDEEVFLPAWAAAF